MKQRIRHIILKKEFLLIAGGKSMAKLLILVGIFGFALLALGINSGLMSHLREKMESPFMRLVEVRNKVGQVTFDELQLPNQYDSIPRFNYWKRRAFIATPGKPRKKAVFFYVAGDYHEKILDLIEEKKENIVIGQSDFIRRAKHPAAVILTEAMATQIGLDFQSGDAVLEINQFATKVENNERGIRFQVAAIVKKLPQNADAVITEAAWSILDANREERDYTNRFAKKCFLVSPADTSAAQQNYAIRSQDSAVTFNESFVISLYANSSNDQWQQIEFIPTEFKSENKLNPTVDIPAGDFIFFPAENLVSLPSQFANALQVAFDAFANANLESNKSPIQLKLTDIQSMRNLGIISGLTQILTVAISLLSLGFVISFVLNLLLQHIANNGPNIGTLQAFGIPNHYIILLYSKIGLGLISIAFILGFLLSLVLGPLVLEGVLSQIGLGDEADQISFSISRPLIIALAFIAFPITVVYFTLQSKLSQSKPGDLIYSRDKTTQQ